MGLTIDKETLKQLEKKNLRYIVDEISGKARIFIASSALAIQPEGTRAELLMRLNIEVKKRVWF